MRWTDEDTSCLISMREEGWQVQEIANEMGYSKSTIEYKLNKLKLLKNKKWTAEEDALVTELTMQGYSIAECAKQLNRSIDNIKHRRVHLKITRVVVPKIPSTEENTYKYSQKPDRLTKVYLIDFGTFYKIGTTQQTITQRFGGRYLPYEVVMIVETSLEEALLLEAKWLKNVKEFKYVPDCFPVEGRGFTECFKF